MIGNWIKQIDDSMKQHTKEFIFMMDEMLDKYCSDEWLVFENVGISKNDYHQMSFTKDNFRRALNFYLKENNSMKDHIESQERIDSIKEKGETICH